MKRATQPGSKSDPQSLQGLHLHLEPVSGIAGDMAVAALVDAGVPPAVIVDGVAAVGVRGLKVHFETRRQGAFVARGFVVTDPGSPGHDHHHDHSHEHSHDNDHGRHEHDQHVHHRSGGGDVSPPRARRRAPVTKRSAAGAVHGPHRDYAEIRRLLARAKLDADAKALAQEIFARLAEVEAALHGTTLDRVAFHEVGAFDSIADIVGMSVAIAWLAPSSIGSSPPVVGTGTVRTAHGLVPVPAPATAALLRGIPMLAEGEGELTTPTGAALLATVVDAFGPPPPLRLVSVGYGAGTRTLADRPNVLRAMLGKPIGEALPQAPEQVVVLEANIDDMTAQLLAALSDALFKAGALDVWSTPIVMKKGRPAQQISALAEPSLLAAVEQAFFANSTTLGLRLYPVSRRTLSRSMLKIATPFGSVAVKVRALDGLVMGSTPEYEDCRRRAAAAGVPVLDVVTAAVAASSQLVPRAAVASPANRGRRGRQSRPLAKRRRR